MPSRENWLAGVVGMLVLSVAAVAGPQTRSVSGVVETSNGNRLRKAEVRATTVGGTVTSDSGEFVGHLPPDFAPGDPIELTLGDDWITTSPWEGRTFVPRRATDTIHLRVGRKGDSQVLTDRKVVQQIVVDVTPQLNPKLASAAQSEEFLAGKAKALGFSVDQLKSAINEWSKKVQEPYHQGLAALYARNYAVATQYIQQSIHSSESDLVGKYISLARAEDEQEHYSQAVAALTTARAIQSENPAVLNNVAVVLMKKAEYAEAEPLYKRALAILEKAMGPEHPDVARCLENLGLLHDNRCRRAGTMILTRM
jgi:hypothetical protein